VGGARRASGSERVTQLLEQVEEILAWLAANARAELHDTEPRKRTLDEVACRPLALQEQLKRCGGMRLALTRAGPGRCVW
jgi:hypothetical protein